MTELRLAPQNKFKHPEVLRAVMDQRQRDLAEGQAAVAQAHEAIQQSAAMARAAILVRHPEIQGLTNEQWPVAMQMLAQKDPTKFAQVKQEIEGAQHLLQTAAQMQAQQQQQAQQYQAAAWQNWSSQQDNAFDAELAKHPPERQAAIRQEARVMLKDYGLSDQDVAWLWQNDLAFRSAPGQRILADAAAFRLQQRTAQTIRPTHAAPKVQRPGSPVERAPEGDVDLRNLSNKLQQTSSARDAAALLAARRARSR